MNFSIMPAFNWVITSLVPRPPRPPLDRITKKRCDIQIIYVRCSFSLILFFLPLSGYIIPFSRSVTARCIGHLCLFTFPFLEDDNRRNMIVHIVIDKKGGTMFQLLTNFRVHHWFTVLSSIICSRCQITATSEFRICDFSNCSTWYLQLASPSLFIFKKKLFQINTLIINLSWALSKLSFFYTLRWTGGVTKCHMFAFLNS